MTSGNFTSISPSAITIDRDKRQRRELRGIPDLARSIEQFGLINPIVVERATMTLVAGERRLTAIRSLGWTSVPVQWAEDCDETTLHALELEENIKRSDLTWQEQADAIRRYHELQRAAAPDWTVAQTARALSMTPNNASEYLSVADALERGDEQVIAAPKMSTALNIVVRKKQRAKAQALATVTTPPTLRIDGNDAPTEVTLPVAPPVPLFNETFSLEWAMAYKGHRFTFIHCDFPYGVNAGEHDQGAGAEFGGYEDSFDTYASLCDTLDRALPWIAAEECHLMFWFSMDYYQWTKDRLEAMGFKVNPFPLVWGKSDNKGILPDAQRGPRRVYETAFLAYRGDPKIVAPVSNFVAHPNTKEVHMSEKPRGMLQHFFRMFVDENTNMLDPTCGSGNAVRVAHDLGAAYVLGLERDAEFHQRAVEAWEA